IRRSRCWPSTLARKRRARQTLEPAMKLNLKTGLVALALASVAVPTLAEAQNRRGGDRWDRRDDRRDDRWDRRGDRWDRRADRRDDRWDRRQDRRDDRWDRRQDRRADRWDRSNRNWWRGRSDFRDYSGRRSGHYY